MHRMNYPCTFTKKIDEDGDPFWRGEQKQLDIVIEEYSFTDCVDELEQTMKKVFRRMTGSDSMDHLIRCQQIAVKGVVSFKLPVNRTLTEFMRASAENVASDEGTDLPDVNEVNMAALEAANAEDIPENWVPKNGDPVVYRKPGFAQECGVFVVVDEEDPEDCWNGEIRIASIENMEDTFLEYLDNLAPSRIGINEIDVCKGFKEYQEQKFLTSIPSVGADGGVADEQ